ncbi:MAG: 50S ribosomal protein L30 [Oscillospiraceae bacterium]|nr:50S ribosomal protein L30 [Oscillospiraceae bacterium]
MAEMRIKLIKSLSGRPLKHAATARSLGLRKIGQEVVRENDPQIAGKISQISYLLRVTEI